jgi:hypothetical protein
MSFYLKKRGRVQPMNIEKIDVDFSICKVADISGVNFDDEFYFLGKTDEEISLVCQSKYVPQNCVEEDSGWKAFRIQGILDFSLIGILSKISTILAEKGIGIFVVSTFNTDYILVKASNFELAIEHLEREGYSII